MEGIQGNTIDKKSKIENPQMDIGKLMREQRSAAGKPTRSGEAKNNALPFGNGESNKSAELPQGVYDVAGMIAKAPIVAAKSILELPKVAIGISRPISSQGDESFQSLALNWKAKVKGFFSGIGGFFKSLVGNKSDKK
jgi:hypothetical protein